MKCQKCGYISFDYNEACPKCNRGLEAERDRLNLPSYKPDPPFLLEPLIRKISDSTLGLEAKVPDSTAVLDMEMTAEDSQAIEAMEIAFSDTQHEQVALEPAAGTEEIQFPETVEMPTPEPVEEAEEVLGELSDDDLALDESKDSISIDLEDLSLEDLTESESGIAPELESEESALGKGDLGSATDRFQTTAPLVSSLMQEELDSLELEDSSLDLEEKAFGEELSLDLDDDEVSLDLEDLASMVKEINKDKDSTLPAEGTKSREVLDLDDLKEDMIGDVDVQIHEHPGKKKQKEEDEKPHTPKQKPGTVSSPVRGVAGKSSDDPEELNDVHADLDPDESGEKGE